MKVELGNDGELLLDSYGRRRVAFVESHDEQPHDLVFVMDAQQQLVVAVTFLAGQEKCGVTLYDPIDGRVIADITTKDGKVAIADSNHGVTWPLGAPDFIGPMLKEIE